MDAEMYRPALTDYDTYYETLAGSVNDVFYYYREQAAFKGKQFQRALNDIAKAIELNPKEVSYYAEQTVINLRVARFEDAIKSADAALAIDPKYGEGYRLKGICQLQLKQDKEACANFAKAKELGDTAVDALIEKHCK
jgi:tetratricopeptide (TPR) repeat protein